MFCLFVFFSLVAGLITGCNLTVEPPSDVLASSDEGQSQAETVRQTATPLEEPTVAPAATVEPRAAAAEPTPSACGGSDAVTARHIMADLHIDYQAKYVQVDERITFVNHEAQPLTDLVLDVQANQWDGAFHLMELTLDGAPASFDLRLNRLTVALPQPLLPGCKIVMGLAFTLQPPPIRDGLRSYRGFFGYSPRQMNLGHFLPTVAARNRGGWRIHEPAGIGEQVVHEVADWNVSVQVTNAAATLQLAGPGAVIAPSPGAWQLALEQSPRFRH